MNRRELLTLGAAAMAGLPRIAPAKNAKRVTVIGAGITGLCCAYELTKRGHEVTILEASARVGGHVRTLKDPLADGLYAEVGAEHFNYPEYRRYWGYVKEFQLAHMSHPVREKRRRFLKNECFQEEDLQRPAVLSKLGFNQRESDFLAGHGWGELLVLYFQPYVDQIEKETDPFAGRLKPLDEITVTDLLRREKASAAALEHFGSSTSALHMIWGAACKKLRGADYENRKLFRLRGGNEQMTQTFAKRLKGKIHLNCPVTAIEQGADRTTVSYRENGQNRKIEADYLVTAISLVALRQIPVSPAWPESKAYVVQEMPYTIKSRVVFQSHTRFWQTDGLSPNMVFSHPKLADLWSMATEVETPRGILVANAPVGIRGDSALETLRSLYPGKSLDVERTVVHDWANDRWAGMCERGSYRPGQLTRFWPEVTRPCGRIHFAGAYASPMSWGQEAAMESANRVADEIHSA